jgi:hypothetical protein
VRRVAAVALIAALLAPGAGAAAGTAADPLKVACGKTLDVPVPGATAAYSVNPSIAEAGLIDGTVQIRGVGAGVTTVMVVAGSATTSLTVTVTAPQLAASFGLAGANQGDGPLSEGGSYQGTYNSGGGTVTNSFEFHERQGDTSRRAAVTLATYVSAQSGSAFGIGFPLISYEIKRPNQDIIYFDALVTTSPLTFQDSLIRGMHVRDGRWSFHAGASSVASFGAYFIPTSPQWVFGATRDFSLGKTSDVAANLYDIVNSSGVEGQIDGGLIGSLLYSYHPQPHFLVQGEVGLSRSVGFGASAVYDDELQHADASIVDKPATFATLVTDAQQGLFGTFDYSRTVGTALNLNASAAKSDYDLPTFRQNTTSAAGNANYRLSKSFSLNAGISYAGYDSIYPTVFNERTASLPISVQYTGGPFTAGLNYQPTTDFSGTFAGGYGASAGYGGRRFQIAASYNHNVDIPTVSSIFSEVPGLQAALEQAGIDVNDPAQLAALLNNAALLASLGFSGLQIDIAPARNDLALNANWIPPGTNHQNVSFSLLDSKAELTDGQFDFRLASLTYARRLTYGDEVDLYAALLQSSESATPILAGASSSPASTARTSQVTYGVSFRHRFGSAPEFLFPTKRGNIDGTVFQDDDLSGRYARSDAGLGGIEVTLDGERTTRTDASGHYRFAGVPFGTHQVAAKLETSKPFFFTTDSPATAAIGSTVNFGVNFVRGQIFGYVTNDAGAGIAGVAVRVQGLDRGATTGSDGRFVIAGVPQGHYRVAATPDSFPAGYDLASLAPAAIDVTANAPWPVNLSARALRSVSGTVTVFDPARRGLAPAPYVTISIPQLGKTARTDAAGEYALRDLPAGTFAVEVDGGTAVERRAVTLPADPTALTGVDFRITADQAQRRLREHERAGHRAGHDHGV